MLCTLQDVRIHVRATTTASDEIIDDLIRMATDLAIRHTRRELIPPTDPGPVPRRFYHDGSGVVRLNPSDARQITGVTVSDGQTTTPLNAGEWRAGPESKEWGVYAWLEVPPTDRSYEAAGRTIEVTGLWGFPQVPDIARQAAIIACRAWLQRPGDYALVEATTPDNQPAAALALPRAAKDLLDRLRIRRWIV